MEIKNLKPRKGSDTYRIGNSDELVVMENLGKMPSGNVRLDDHGVIIMCTEGMAQLEYDGLLVKLKKNDLFLYMAHSVASNIMASSDFNCRQIWFGRADLWNINIYSETSLSDMFNLKLHPVASLNAEEIAILDDYFKLLCHRMKDTSSTLMPYIVRSLVGTFLLEALAMMRRNAPQTNTDGLSTLRDNEHARDSFHKRWLVDRFMSLVEQSDGRVRRIDELADQLNVTPKYLSTVIKEVMNRRPSIYIQLFTMKAIERRLRFTDMTIQEIANELKFPNASFFGKYFKEHSGMTPKEYRMKWLTS